MGMMINGLQFNEIAPGMWRSVLNFDGAFITVERMANTIWAATACGQRGPGRSADAAIRKLMSKDLSERFVSAYTYALSFSA